MNNSTLIKLGSVNNLSDARYAAAVGVSYIGFCFDPKNPQYVPPIKAKEMMDWITGSHLVAEFGNQTSEEMKDICELLKVDVIEVENDLPPEDLKELDKPVIKKINLADFDLTGLTNLLNAYSEVADAFHVYAEKTTLTDEALKDLCSRFKIIWGLPIDKENTLSTIETYGPYAIHLTGGDEERPGVKDFEELSEIIELVIPQL